MTDLLAFHLLDIDENVRFSLPLDAGGDTVDWKTSLLLASALLLFLCAALLFRALAFWTNTSLSIEIDFDSGAAPLRAKKSASDSAALLVSSGSVRPSCVGGWLGLSPHSDGNSCCCCCCSTELSSSGWLSPTRVSLMAPESTSGWSGPITPLDDIVECL